MQELTGPAVEKAKGKGDPSGAHSRKQGGWIGAEEVPPSGPATRGTFEFAARRRKLEHACPPRHPPMPEPASEPTSDSSLYREFLAEREEILLHKWLMSEREGSDVGFERALTDWALKHRPEWKKNFLKDLKSQPAD